MSEEIDDLEAAALHEAGHAVVAVGLGLADRITMVHLKAGVDGWGGSTIIDPSPNPAAVIAIACAGALAQMRLTSALPQTGYEGDMGKAWSAAVAIALQQFPEDDDTKDQYVHVAVGSSLAGRFLNLAWSHVETVAGVLQKAPHTIENLADVVPVQELVNIWNTVIAGC